MFNNVCRNRTIDRLKKFYGDDVRIILVFDGESVMRARMFSDSRFIVGPTSGHVARETGAKKMKEIING